MQMFKVKFCDESKCGNDCGGVIFENLLCYSFLILTSYVIVLCFHYEHLGLLAQICQLQNRLGYPKRRTVMLNKCA